MEVYFKGLFWFINGEVFCRYASCDENRNLLQAAEFENNHKRLWNTLPKSITQGKAYNYFPRGRVEIRRGQATVYLSPYLCTDEIYDKIRKAFSLDNTAVFKADGSSHYSCYIDHQSQKVIIKSIVSKILNMFKKYTISSVNLSCIF